MFNLDMLLKVALVPGAVCAIRTVELGLLPTAVDLVVVE